MNPQKYQQLQAERGMLDSLLERIPPSRAIERLGLVSRRDEIDAALESCPEPEEVTTTPSRRPHRDHPASEERSRRR